MRHNVGQETRADFEAIDLVQIVICFYRCKLDHLVEARIATPGSDATVGRGGVRRDNFESVHGAAYRGIYDLADQERSRFVVAPGQSGNPLTGLARNFLQRWHDGDTISIPSRPASVAVRIGLSP